ncbi:Guanine nucleotide exchange factor LTE1 [Yarrowia sp. C11]|nr:Guanine nucleotide exchange factor LTE1 [Yarrowia sp. C11]KAG5371243.1 Guanine nucleotide exchange factor LTE1 [Yarrowia sp. E02]
MFMDATDLLQLLLDRLEWAIGVQNEVNQALRQSQNARNSEKGRDVCVRTFVVLRHWVLNFFADDFVPSHTIRSKFADTLNRLNDTSMVQQDANSQRIVFQLKSIWSKSVSMYWNVPQDLGTIYSGGLVGEKLDAENKNANHRLSFKQPHIRRKTILSLYQDIPVYNPEAEEGNNNSGHESIPSIWTNSSIDGIADDDHPLKRGHSTINGHIIRGGIAAPRNAGLTLIQPPTPIKSFKTAEGSLVSSPEVKDILQKKYAKSRSTRQSLNMKLVRFATRIIGEHEMEELSREHVSPRVTESISLDLRYDVLGQRVLQELRHLVESKEKQLNNMAQNEEVFEGFTFAQDGDTRNILPNDILGQESQEGQEDDSAGKESSKSYLSYTSSLDFDFNLVSTPQKPGRLKKQQRYSNLNLNSPTKQPRSPTKENRGKLTPSFIEAINYSVRNSDIGDATESCGMFGVDAEAVAGLAQIPDDTTEEDAIVAALQKLEGTYVKGERKQNRERELNAAQGIQQEGIDDQTREGGDIQNSIIGLYDHDDSVDPSMVHNVSDLDIPAGFKPSKSLGRRPSPNLNIDVSGGASDAYLPDAIEFGASSIPDLFTNGRHLPFILNYDAETLAQHMTLIERDSLAEVDWKELIEARWNKKLEPVQSWTSYLVGKTNIGVDMVITRFNLVVNWVISEILLTKRLAERICVVSRFIHIAFLCREMQNFATLMQIVLALSSSHVSRLKETWHHILPQDKKILAELEQIVVPLKNFHNLRKEFGSIDPEKGCIPFVGLSLSDLTFNNERLKVSENGDVNFEQYKTSASIVKSLIQCIEWSKNYSFQTDVDIVAKCLYLQCLTSAEMDQCFDYLVDP